ncbi:MAG: helix-hairpin-helix domain-containing protein [Nannocystaceae bacterium]
MPATSVPLSAARLLGLVLGLVALLLVDAALARPPLLVVGRPCTHAVEVDGQLTCDADAPTTLADLCPHASILPLVRSGDALRRGLVCALPEPRRGGVGWRRLAPSTLAALEIPIHLNEAGADELEALPGVGPVLARRIVDARPYTRVTDLDRVKGIGPKKLAALRGRVRVSW